MRPDWEKHSAPEDAFVRHVQLASPEFVDAYFRDESLTVELGKEGSIHTVTGSGNQTGTGSGTVLTVGQPYNYEKWVGIARKVTNDYHLYA